MKRIYLFALAALMVCAASCQKKASDPIKDAISSALMEQNAGMKSFTFYTYELKDSVTLSQELDRRQKLFETKVKAESAAVMKYDAERKPKTKEVHFERLTAARAILGRIEEYRMSSSFRPDSVIYYIAEFSGAGKMDGGSVETGIMSVTVSPGHEVYGFQPAGANPCKGMGVAIPGYRDKILASDFGLEEGE